jgi:hypothetical protein
MSMDFHCPSSQALPAQKEIPPWQYVPIVPPSFYPSVEIKTVENYTGFFSFICFEFEMFCKYYGAQGRQMSRATGCRRQQSAFALWNLSVVKSKCVRCAMVCAWGCCQVSTARMMN